MLSAPADAEAALSEAYAAVQCYNNELKKTNLPEIEVVHWSRDVLPEAGNRPQSIINRQLLDRVDAVIAIFKSRFGSSTGHYKSGTEEEVRRAIEAGKRVLVYFSEEPVPLKIINEQQLLMVREFQKEFPGIYGTYADGADLQEKIYTHLFSIAELFVKGTDWVLGRQVYNADYLAYISSVTHKYNVYYKIMNNEGDTRITRKDKFKVNTDYTMTRTCGLLISTPFDFEFEPPTPRVLDGSRNFEAVPVAHEPFLQPINGQGMYQFGWHYDIVPPAEYMDFIDIETIFDIPKLEKDAFEVSRGSVFHVQDHINVCDAQVTIELGGSLRALKLLGYWSQNRDTQFAGWGSKNVPILASDGRKIFWLSDPDDHESAHCIRFSVEADT